MRHCLSFAGTLILAAVGAGSPILASKADDQTVVLQDGEPYFQGSYGAYASPWSTFFDHALVRGTDFLDKITLRRSTFPDGTIIDSRWPLSKPKKSGVWGYHAVSFGNYDGGHPLVPVRSQQVASIHEISEEFEFSYEGSASFNLLNEFYLTSQPGNAAAKVIEIGLFLHAPEVSMSFIRGGKWIGYFTEPQGRSWTVTRTKDFVMIAPRDAADVRRGRVDLLPILAFLIDKGVITGREWFNGIAFGMEPVEGAGQTRLRIEHWRVAYQ